MDRMSVRRARLVVVCEDSQHETFVRRFLQGMGWNRRDIVVSKSPGGRGAAERWVRERFPRELTAYRRRRARAASGLVLVIDADSRTPPERENQLSEACGRRGIPSREEDEAVAVAVPRRNIETWIHFLEGREVDEREAYPKLERARECRTAVQRLLDMCRSTGLPRNAPPSLNAACNEYSRRIKPLEV